MKSVRAMVLPILLAGIGCVTFPSLKEESTPKPAPKPPALSQDLAPAAVNPDEVTDSNAREKAEALRRELSTENK
jgi:hypothetical protein